MERKSNNIDDDDVKKESARSAAPSTHGAVAANHRNDEARQRKLENEQRRASVWQSERVESSQSNHGATYASRNTTHQPNRKNVTPSTGSSTIPTGGRRLSSFLTEKQHIAGRSLRRMSATSRRSILSTSQHSTQSSESAVSEKTVIANRSQRRLEAREAATTCRQMQREQQLYSAEVMTHPKAGTAEMILTTVSEDSGSHATMEYSSQRSDSTVPDTWHLPPSYSGDLVMAVVVDDEEDGVFRSEIPYAAEVVAQERPFCRRLPVLVCLALFCLVAINIGVVLAVVKSRSQTSPDGSIEEEEDRASQPSTDDQDDLSQPTLVPSLAPSKAPTLPLNDGRLTTQPSTSTFNVPSGKDTTKAPTASNGNGNGNGDGNGTGNSNGNGRPAPTAAPSASPNTMVPSVMPSVSPSQNPTQETPAPTPSPTKKPTPIPSDAPSQNPSSTPTFPPTLFSFSGVLMPSTNVRRSPSAAALLPTGNGNGNGNGNGY